MKKEVKIVFINEKLKSNFEELDKSKTEDKQLYNFLNRAIEDLKENPFCWIMIKKKLWLKEYKKYFLTNLWKYDLPNAWRLIYTIESDEIRIVNIILEWFNHKEYNRRFGYN